MSSRWIPRIPAQGSGGGGPPGPPGPDHFGPKYLVGNIPAGDDPVAYNVNGFRYIPDPGDGSGIALALTLPNGLGDVWIRPGTYTKAQGRFVVPANCRVWGSGAGSTTIIGNGVDNTIWELSEQSELAWLRCNTPAGAGLVGTEVVRVVATVSYIHDIVVDASAGTADSSFIAGVAYAGGGGGPGPAFSRLHNNVLVGPSNGLTNPARMFANVRGLTISPSDTIVVDAQSNTLIAGDAAIVSLGDTQTPAQGVSFIVGRAFAVGPAVVGFYFNLSPLIMSTGPSVVLAFASTTIAGAIVLNGFQYEFGSTIFINLTDQGLGPVPVPAIIVSEPTPIPGNPPTSVTAHECTFVQWGDQNDVNIPQVLLGQNAEIVRSAHIVNCRFISNPNVTPVVLGAGCSNSLVGLNTSDGSGGVNALDLGAGNAPNVNNLWT